MSNGLDGCACVEDGHANARPSSVHFRSFPADLIASATTPSERMSFERIVQQRQRTEAVGLENMEAGVPASSTAQRLKYSRPYTGCRITRSREDPATTT